MAKLIKENVSGMTFESGYVENLKGKIVKMWNAEFDYPYIARDAVVRYSNEAYYEKLMDIYSRPLKTCKYL